MTVERKKIYSFPDIKSYKLSIPEQSSLNICAYYITNETQSVELMSLCDVTWFWEVTTPPKEKGNGIQYSNMKFSK